MNTQNNYIRIKAKGISPLNEEECKVQIPLKNGELWENVYKQIVKIKSIINDFKQKTNEEIPEEYIKDWKTKNQSLNMNAEIKSLITKEIPNLYLNNNLSCKNKPIQIGQLISPDYIGKPFSNPFEIFVFHKKNKILKVQKYPQETIQKNNLNYFNISSAYCNGGNSLFISGGETENLESIQKFWKIDLEDQEILTTSMLVGKKNHSIIYIPNNFIFIVGGNDLRTFYYDIKMNEFISWVDLNKKTIEPSLALVNNYLYCFENVNLKINSMRNDAFILEKTDITSENPAWMLIKPNINLLFGNQKFFGTINNNNNIIFIGGNMYNEDSFIGNNNDNNKYNLKYDVNLNTIEPTNIPFKEYYLKEKTFLPYNENIDYILPDFNRFHPEVLFYQKNKNKLSLVKYESFNGNNVSNIYNKSFHDNKFNLDMPILSSLKNDNKDIKNEDNNNNEIENMKINEPSFVDINLDINDNIKQSPQFKPPEVNAYNPDVKISLNMPNLFDESKKDLNVKDIDKIEKISECRKEKVFQIGINIPYKNSKKTDNIEEKKNNDNIGGIKDNLKSEINNNINNNNDMRNPKESTINKNNNLKGPNNPIQDTKTNKNSSYNCIDFNQKVSLKGVILGVKRDKKDNKNSNSNKKDTNQNSNNINQNNKRMRDPPKNVNNPQENINNNHKMIYSNGYRNSSNKVYQNMKSPHKNINRQKVNLGKSMNTLTIDFTKNVDIQGVIPGKKNKSKSRNINNNINSNNINKVNNPNNNINSNLSKKNINNQNMVMNPSNNFNSLNLLNSKENAEGKKNSLNEKDHKIYSTTDNILVKNNLNNNLTDNNNLKIGIKSNGENKKIESNVYINRETDDKK